MVSKGLGLVAGLAAGLAVGAAGLGALSALAPQRALNRPPAPPQVEAGAPPEAAGAPAPGWPVTDAPPSPVTAPPPQAAPAEVSSAVPPAAGAAFPMAHPSEPAPALGSAGGPPVRLDARAALAPPGGGSWPPALAAAPLVAADPPGGPAVPDADAPRRLAADASVARPTVPARPLLPVAEEPPANAPGVTEVASGPAPEPTAEPAPEPALTRFAAAFAPSDPPLPLFAVLILDDGLTPGAAEAIADLGFPVSVALDPRRADAAAAMAGYRARGVEVLALADLAPEAADAGAAHAAILAAIPEAVAVLDLGAGRLQGESAAGDAALAVLARGGQGAVMLPRGLDSGLRAAASAGVPAATILRDLDGAGGEAQALRLLDDAARRAGQEGRAVVLARPASLPALALWGDSPRAAEVDLAPISAVLAR